MIVVVTGGRDYDDRERVSAALERLHAEAPIEALLHGACGATWPRVLGPELTGADRWAHEWATDRLPADKLNALPANWERYGKSAGPRRNGHMIEFAGQLSRWDERRVLVLACPGGAGTADCVRQARASGLTVKTLDDVLGEIETQTEALASDWWSRVEAQRVLR